MKYFTAATVVLLLTACNGGSSGAGGGLETGNDQTGNAETLLSACQSPRTQVCTREYAPVCGKLNNGELETFANACEACANEAVGGYYPSACAAAGMKACEGPRPEVCTLDYRPVCGQLGDSETKTFGNACMACGDTSVIGFFEGECS
jgi:hypothetical protein